MDNRIDEYCFVYGTLKRGYGNHHRLYGEEFVGNAQIYGHTLYTVGFPCAVPTGDEDDHIRGEIYRVRRQSTMDSLDGLEGTPVMFRRERATAVTDDGEEIGVWFYVWNYDYDRLPRIGSTWDGYGVASR